MASTTKVLGKGNITESVSVGLREALVLVARSFPGTNALDFVPLLSRWGSHGHRVIQPWKCPCARCFYTSAANCRKGTKVVELYVDYSFRNGVEATVTMTQVLHGGGVQPADPWEVGHAVVTIQGRRLEYIVDERRKDGWFFVRESPYSTG